MSGIAPQALTLLSPATRRSAAAPADVAAPPSARPDRRTGLSTMADYFFRLAALL